MKHLLHIITAVLCALPTITTAQTAIGHWRDCPDLGAIYHVEVADSKVFAAGRTAMFALDTTTQQITTYSRATGMSDAGIATIAFDTQSHCLVVAYNNSNIDILHSGHIYNIPDIRRTELSANKGIGGIAFHDSTAYISTGFGVVVISLRRYEIAETWFLGAGGAQTPVYSLAFTADSIYAATGRGMLRTSIHEPLPQISDRWQPDSALAYVNVQQLSTLNGHLIAAGFTYDPEVYTIYTRTTGTYQPLHTGRLRSMHTSPHGLALCIDDTVYRYDTTLQYVAQYADYTWAHLEATDAVVDNHGTLWASNTWDGITAFFANGTDNTYRPDSPLSGDNVYRLVPFRNHMMLCPGGHTTTYTNTYILPQLCTATGRHWQMLSNDNGMLAEMYDVVDAAVNPKDTTETVAALWSYGVASIRDNSIVEMYTDANTSGALRRFSVDDYSSLRTGALVFDRKGQLWVTVSHSSHALAVRHTDGSWQGVNTTTLAPQLQVDKIIYDSVRGYLWFAGNSNAIYVYDGTSRLSYVDPNNGSHLQTESVNALVQDRSGNLWVGTNKGIKVIYDGYKAFAQGGNGERSAVTCSNITITNGSFAEYLMAYENITAIAVDGANRKWVGTANGGVYLISANGLEQLEHFTANNSPLYSNKVVTLAVQPRTGEVYIGTDMGLQVYRSTATYAEQQPAEAVYAYPNPVRPGYSGAIAIKGFTRDGLVHITDAAGHTVYSTQALGGQAIWYGRTNNGDEVASGVYYVFASDAEGSNRSVAKILIIR